MNRLFEKIQPVVKEETKKVAVSTGVGLVLMLGVFAGLHIAMPDQVPFDYTVVLAGVIGSTVAVLNFLFMGITIQNIVADENEDRAKLRMKSSYSKRMLMQVLWGVLALAAPCFHPVAGLVPLLFPSIGVKIRGILKK